MGESVEAGVGQDRSENVEFSDTKPCWIKRAWRWILSKIPEPMRHPSLLGTTAYFVVFGAAILAVSLFFWSWLLFVHYAARTKFENAMTVFSTASLTTAGGFIALVVLSLKYRKQKSDEQKFDLDRAAQDLELRRDSRLEAKEADLRNADFEERVIKYSAMLDNSDPNSVGLGLLGLSITSQKYSVFYERLKPGIAEQFMRPQQFNQQIVDSICSFIRSAGVLEIEHSASNQQQALKTIFDHCPRVTQNLQGVGQISWATNTVDLSDARILCPIRIFGCKVRLLANHSEFLDRFDVTASMFVKSDFMNVAFYDAFSVFGLQARGTLRFSNASFCEGIQIQALFGDNIVFAFCSVAGNSEIVGVGIQESISLDRVYFDRKPKLSGWKMHSEDMDLSGAIEEQTDGYRVNFNFPSDHDE